MPSSLHISTSSASPQKRSSSSPSPASIHKKQKMSLTQTYFLAHTARAKLSKEASRGDHNLRLLVGHANLLDGLMIDLVEAERSQEAIFNSAAKQSTHITWADQPTRQPTITEDFEEDDSSDSEDEEEEIPSIQTAISQSLVTVSELSEEDDDDQATDDEEEDYEHLALVRTSSHSSPPELLHEFDDDSDEDSLPPSPPAPNMPLSFPSVSGKKSNSETISNAFYEEGFYVPSRPRVAVY